MDQSLILHHYDMSPFSEKIRVMLGYAGLNWQSLKVPAQPPRPSLDEMLDGYRRIPVAQMGADFFCDTKMIAAEIARLAGRSEVSHESLSNEDRLYAAYLEDEIFQTCLSALSPGAILGGLVRGLGFQMFKFIKDRAKLARAGGISQMPRKEAQTKWRAHLLDVNRRVGDQFIGGELPNAVDFAAYHLLWFHDEIAGKKSDADLLAVRNWQTRMSSFRRAPAAEIDVRQSLMLATSNQPAKIDPPDMVDPMIGKEVGIAPTDYARTETRGQLVGSMSDSWIIKKMVSDRPVHIHFPKEGFAIA